MNPTKIVLAAGAMFAASMMLSFVHPWGNPHVGMRPDAPLMEGTEMPAGVRQLLEAKCADCHSSHTHYPAYGRLAPASWLIERDVLEGRNHLDLSRWQGYSDVTRIDLLTKIASEAHSGQMPVKHYLLLHPRARLSPGEQQLIYDWAKSERKHVRHQVAAMGNSSLANGGKQ